MIFFYLFYCLQHYISTKLFYFYWKIFHFRQLEFLLYVFLVYYIALLPLKPDPLTEGFLKMDTSIPLIWVLFRFLNGRGILKCHFDVCLLPVPTSVLVLCFLKSFLKKYSFFHFVSIVNSTEIILNLFFSTSRK